MTPTRIGACLLCLAAVWAAAAGAQDFPAHPVRFVVPLPAGGTLDLIARTVGPPAGRALGQNVLVENRPGASSVIGTEAVARAPADGHTVLLVGNAFTMNPTLRPKLPYDTVRDFAAVARVAANPLVIAVHPSLPARTLKELVALARSRPGELTYASGTAAGGLRLNAERFKAAAGIDIVNVPYQGGAPAVIAVMGGHTSILMVNVSETVPQIASGRLRALAVTSLVRSDALKDVPTVAESGFPGFEALMWYGAVARSGTPGSVIERLGAALSRSLQLADVKDALARVGLAGAPLGQAEFDAFLKVEFERNAKLIKALNLKAE